MFSFIETKRLSRLLPDYLTEDDFAVLQGALSENPERGSLVPGSGGVRKLRWTQPGRGKRGGIRVIYYAQTHEGVIWMLTIYAKYEKGNIRAHVLREIREENDG